MTSDLRTIQLIVDHVRSGHVSPVQGALLIELRREIASAQRSWWRKAVSFMGRVWSRR